MKNAPFGTQLLMIALGWGVYTLVFGSILWLAVRFARRAVHRYLISAAVSAGDLERACTLCEDYVTESLARIDLGKDLRQDGHDAVERKLRRFVRAKTTSDLPGYNLLLWATRPFSDKLRTGQDDWYANELATILEEFGKVRNISLGWRDRAKDAGVLEEEPGEDADQHATSRAIRNAGIEHAVQSIDAVRNTCVEKWLEFKQAAARLEP